MPKSPFILTVANHKGGVGKTTTAVALATGFAKLGYPTILIDCDPQGNVAHFLGIDAYDGFCRLVIEKEGPAAATLHPQYETLAVVPGNSSTLDVEELLSSGRRYSNDSALKSALKPFHSVGKKRTVIIMDTSPSISNVQFAALFASDWLIVPAIPEFASEAGIGQLVNAVSEIKEAKGQIELLGILPTMFDKRSNEHKEVIGYLKETFNGLMLPPIRRLIALGEAPRSGKPIWDYAPQSEAAVDYGAVLREVKRYV